MKRSFYENDPNLQTYMQGKPVTLRAKGKEPCETGLKQITTEEERAAREKGTALNAKEICEISTSKDESDITNFLAGLEKMNPLSKIPSGNESITDNKNVLNMIFSANQIDCFKQNCDMSSEVTQNNTISNKCCLDAGISPKECAEAFSVKNVKQVNVNDSIKNCHLAQMSKVVRETTLDVSTLTVMNIIQKAKGILANNKEKSNICNFINMEISADQFMTNISKCIQDTNAKQTNLIECAAVEGVTQANYNKEVTKCFIQAGVDLDSKLSMKIATAVHLKKDQTAEGLTLDFLFMLLLIIGVIICVVIGAFVFLSKKGMETSTGMVSGK